jgi:Tol biopolymer transport system component
MMMAVGLLASCSPSPSLPPLLVVTDDHAVTAISPDGETVALVEADPNRLVSQATWSPDGRLAVWTEVDTAAGQAVIAMGDSQGQRRIDGGTVPFFYAWSPPGDHVAYLGNSPDGAGVAMGLVDVAEGTARLVDRGSPYYLDWAPDGSRLAIHVDTTFVGFVDLDGNRTTLDAEPGRFQAPQFLDDGRLLVATAGDTPGVSLSSAETPQPVVIAPTTGGTFFAASPDGSILAFTDTDDAPILGSLATIKIAGADEPGPADQPETVSEGPVVAFEWSPSGKQLLFLTVNEEGTALIPQVWEEGSARAYDELVPTQEMIGQYLPFWDQYSRVLTLWAPDGESFVLPVHGEGGGSIVVYDVATGDTKRVHAGRFASWAPAG